MANNTVFQQPDLTSLTTKSLKLNALYQVKSHAVTQFKKLQDQKTLIDDAVRSMMGSRRDGSIHLTNSEQNTDQQRPSNGHVYFQRNASQAEQTMQRYTPNDRHDQNNEISQPKVPTKFNPSTGQLHPWNP